MCIVVFMASDEPLPTVSAEEISLFHAWPVLQGSSPVLRLFSKPHVYELSKFAGYKARRESVGRLKGYLRLAVGKGTAEVYSCWEGDEEEEPETRLDVSVDHFGGDVFDFVECQFLTVRRG